MDVNKKCVKTISLSILLQEREKDATIIHLGKSTGSISLLEKDLKKKCVNTLRFSVWLQEKEKDTATIHSGRLTRSVSLLDLNKESVNTIKFLAKPQEKEIDAITIHSGRSAGSVLFLDVDRNKECVNTNTSSMWPQEKGTTIHSGRLTESVPDLNKECANIIKLSVWSLEKDAATIHSCRLTGSGLFLIKCVSALSCFQCGLKRKKTLLQCTVADQQRVFHC